ncbi:MAG TPA: Ig-like domain-containing protein, partial [Gammaproteobacteria bacterium]
MKRLMLSLAMAAVAGCSGDAGFSTSGSDTDTTSVTVASITLLSSSPQLGSSGVTPVTITAIVKDSGNLVTEDIPVVFSADSGSLQVTQSVTDAAG